jgi:hypothetical protein
MSPTTTITTVLVYDFTTFAQLRPAATTISRAFGRRYNVLNMYIILWNQF